MPMLKPQSNWPLCCNAVIGTLAVDGWTVTFGTARRGLGGLVNNVNWRNGLNQCGWYRLHAYGFECDLRQRKGHKKLSYCWNSSRCDMPTISDSGRSASPSHNPKYDLQCKFHFINRFVCTWNTLPSYVVSAIRVHA